MRKKSFILDSIYHIQTREYNIKARPHTIGVGRFVNMGGGGRDKVQNIGGGGGGKGSKLFAGCKLIGAPAPN